MQDNRDNGVEMWAAETFGWEHVDNGYYDLVAEDGTLVEAKGCLRWISDGVFDRRGRFRLWAKEHQRLIDDDGEYLLAVYEELNFEEPWLWKRIPADEMTEHVGDFYNFGYRTGKGRTVQVSWRHVFPDEVEE